MDRSQNFESLNVAVSIRNREVCTEAIGLSEVIGRLGYK